jgi:hypothetical protein
MNRNPYLIEPRSPIYMPPPLPPGRKGDPEKVDHGSGMPQSRSEPMLHGMDGQQETKLAECRIPTQTRSRSNPSSEAASTSRGRLVNRPNSPVNKLQDVNENEVLEVQKASRERSRSPFKRLLGMGKSSGLKDIAGEPQARAREEETDKSKRTGLKVWGDKFKHAGPKEAGITPPPLASIPSVSLNPPYQAKVYSEMELMICVTANEYLISEYAAGRISAESIAKVSTNWSNKNRPQVIEFQYDQATQRDLILHNLTTLKFHGESADSPLVLNATLDGWKAMAKEMNVRTFCALDSAVRKHMHNAYKILDMLGVPFATYLAFQELRWKTLAIINDAAKKIEEKRREERQKEIEGRAETYARKNSKEAASQSQHPRKKSGEEYQYQHSRKASREEGETKQHMGKISKEEKEMEKGAVKGFGENSRGGRLGLMVRGERYA